MVVRVGRQAIHAAEGTYFARELQHPRWVGLLQPTQPNPGDPSCWQFHGSFSRSRDTISRNVGVTVG
jgi:hypothetical protein